MIDLSRKRSKFFRGKEKIYLLDYQRLRRFFKKNARLARSAVLEVSSDWPKKSPRWQELSYLSIG